MYKYHAPHEVVTQMAIVYFPGWELSVDGHRRDDDISMSDDGLLKLKLPSGAHTAELKYGLSPIGRIARNISYLAWTVWASAAIFLALQRWKKSTGNSLSSKFLETRSSAAG